MAMLMVSSRENWHAEISLRGVFISLGNKEWEYREGKGGGRGGSGRERDVRSVDVGDFGCRMTPMAISTCKHSKDSTDANSLLSASTAAATSTATATEAEAAAHNLRKLPTACCHIFHWQ